jgi:uncharacterized protein (DUF2147 family)
MRRRCILFAMLVAAPVAAGAVAFAAASTPHGVWQTQNGKARIRLHDCGVALCGRIVWMQTPTRPDGTPKRDSNNPDPAKRGRPVVGLRILSGLTRDRSNPRLWTGGRVYSPQSGRTYGLQIELLDGGRLEVRGYLGVPSLGGSQIWTWVKP